TGRPRADDADPLAFKLDILRPGTGVDQGATKGVAALDVGQVDLRQQAQSAHDIAGGDGLAVAGRDGPAVLASSNTKDSMAVLSWMSFPRSWRSTTACR